MSLRHNEKFSGVTTGVTATYNDSLGGNVNNTMVTVKFGAGTGAGTLLVEVADDPAYAGTWATLATIAWAVADSIKTGLVTGPWKAMRLRWSANVTGGTADVTVQMN